MAHGNAIRQAHGLRFSVLSGGGRIPIRASVFCRVHLRPAAKKAGVVIPEGYRRDSPQPAAQRIELLVNKPKENPKTVQGILRHSRIQTTLDLARTKTSKR